MIKTKIKKAFALAWIVALVGTNLSTTFAATDVGNITVTGSGAMTQDIMWDDSIPGFATGSVSGIIVTAQILPTINMTISADSINLGTLLANVTSSGTLDIEVGTNAANGVNITARSWSGGLTNLGNNSIQINNNTTDGVQESYTFASTANATDSLASGFSSTGDLTAVEVINNTTEHIIYTTNKPEQDNATVQDLTFKVAATANAESQAGSYKDEITFTITGKF